MSSFSMTRCQWRGALSQPTFGDRPAPVKRAKGRPQSIFAFDVPDFGLHVEEAHTKSEARAKLKRRLGLDRLPAGTRCQTGETGVAA